MRGRSAWRLACVTTLASLALPARAQRGGAPQSASGAPSHAPLTSPTGTTPLAPPEPADGGPRGKPHPSDGAAPSIPSAAPPPPREPKSAATCAEHLAGASGRPDTRERFPARGTSGYTANLEVVVTHGKGETVLPTGFEVKLGDELAALEKRGFYLPAGDGGTAPSTTTTEEGTRAQTTLTIPFLLLPPESGRQTLTLPPVPVAIARASGAVITLCTEPHQIVVEDPTANDPHAKPKGNPRPEAQREEWTAAKNAAMGAAAALVFGALVAWLASWWMRRERPAPPPPPPRPPWEVALEELFDIEQSRLVEQGRFAIQFDRVSHAVRQYLGDRYGFDGLESTTHEIMGELGRLRGSIPVLESIGDFLTHADLVKFAKATPTEAECVRALEQGREIVHRTMPSTPAPPDDTSAPPSEPPDGPPPEAQP